MVKYKVYKVFSISRWILFEILLCLVNSWTDCYMHQLNWQLISFRYISWSSITTGMTDGAKLYEMRMRKKDSAYGWARIWTKDWLVPMSKNNNPNLLLLSCNCVVSVYRCVMKETSLKRIKVRYETLCRARAVKRAEIAPMTLWFEGPGAMSQGNNIIYTELLDQCTTPENLVLIRALFIKI